MQRPPPQRPTAQPMPAVGRGAPKCYRSCLGRRPAKKPGERTGRRRCQFLLGPQASTELFGPTGGGITTKTHRTAHAGGGKRSPQVLPELFGAPSGGKTQGRQQGGSPADFLLGPQASTESVARMAARRTVEANVSAARRADAATAAAANNEAAASAAKHAYVASAARRSYGGRANETGGGGRVRGRCPQGRRQGNGLRRDAHARDYDGPTHGRRRSGSGCVNDDAEEDDGASPRR
jgi:hypothetical protein